MDDKYKVGDQVKIRLPGGIIARGVIRVVTQSWMYQPNNPITEYGVQYENTGKMGYYQEKDLLIDDSGYKFDAKCTCGAKSVYAPKEPPGHGQSCQLEQNDRVVKGYNK